MLFLFKKKKAEVMDLVNVLSLSPNCEIVIIIITRADHLGNISINKEEIVSAVFEMRKVRLPHCKTGGVFTDIIQTERISEKPSGECASKIVT